MNITRLCDVSDCRNSPYASRAADKIYSRASKKELFKAFQTVRIWQLSAADLFQQVCSMHPRGNLLRSSPAPGQHKDADGTLYIATVVFTYPSGLQCSIRY